MPVGGVFVSGPGKLPCKHIIHAVGPIWSGGHAGERNDHLYLAVRESLQAAKDNNCQSIALPVISAGIFGYPRDKAIDRIVDSVQSYYDSCDGPSDVYLVDNTVHGVNSIHEGLLRTFDKTEVEDCRDFKPPPPPMRKDARKMEGTCKY